MTSGVIKDSMLVNIINEILEGINKIFKINKDVFKYLSPFISAFTVYFIDLMITFEPTSFRGTDAWGVAFRPSSSMSNVDTVLHITSLGIANILANRIVDEALVQIKETGSLSGSLSGSLKSSPRVSKTRKSGSLKKH